MSAGLAVCDDAVQFYTAAADGSFIGLDADGDYVAAPDGSGLSDTDLAGFDTDLDGGGDVGGLFDWF